MAHITFKAVKKKKKKRKCDTIQIKVRQDAWSPTTHLVVYNERHKQALNLPGPHPCSLPLLRRDT